MNIQRGWFLLLVSAVAFGLSGCASALSKAAEQGNAVAVEKILSDGADINQMSPDSAGRWITTPLAHAAKSGNVDLVRLLIDKGADLNVGYPPPLANAVLYGQRDTAMLLLERGANAEQSREVLEKSLSQTFYSAEAAKGAELLKSLDKELRKRKLAEDDERFQLLAKLYRGEVGGVGINLKIQEEVPVAAEVSEGAAAAAGMKGGDRILRIGEKSTKGLKLDEVVNLIVGPVGTLVKMSIIRGGSDIPLELTMTRARVNFVFPEEARKYKVQAESAVRDKNYAEAAVRFGKALSIAPWWPEGRFNRAIVLAETGEYPTAISEMRSYLLLVPAAPDARAAQDKIYEWEGHTEKVQAAEVPLPSPKAFSRGGK